MKRCPECDARFPDTDQFCEIDGTTLVADHSATYAQSPERPVATAEYQYLSPLAREARLTQNWKLLAIVAIVGVAIGMTFFVVYQRITQQVPEQNSNQAAANEGLAQQQQAFPPARHTPSPSESPAPEPSPSPTALPSPAAPAESARVTLSSSPVSTGGDEKSKRGPVTIHLTNGTSVEADEAWETGEGIWYRRRGVVSLLERNEVKAIERVIEKASPAPPPTSSPIASP
jgi:cytoskeletal protein RodZ